MKKNNRTPWYKTHWKLELITIAVALILGIPAYILLFKPQKVIIDKPTKDIAMEQKLDVHFTETNTYPNVVPLRKLKPLETGKRLNEVPDNIYGFVHPWTLSWNSKVSESEKKITLSNEREVRYFFEVQKFNNTYYLVGFIGDESYANIGEINKSNPRELTVFALPWENFKNIVAIPFTSIAKVECREINIGGGRDARVLDLVTNSVITNIQGHDLK